MTQSTSSVQSGRRKRTDLIPTIPIHRGEGDRSPRSPLYASSSGASSSRGSVSRSTGMSVSLSRLDQLSQPRRRLLSSQNTIPSSSSPLQPLHETDPTPTGAATTTTSTTAPTSTKTAARPSRPTRLHASSTSTSPSTTAAARSMSKSMSHLASPKVPQPAPVQSADGQPRTTRAERLRLKARQASQRPIVGGSLGARLPPHICFAARLLQRLRLGLSAKMLTSSLTLSLSQRFGASFAWTFLF